jgi:pilus assembly protein CpaF
MTKNSFKKNAIRERMALTGESYLESTRRMDVMPPLTLDDLIKRGALNTEMAEFLRSKVAAKRSVNFIITGGRGSGKSTLLSALAAEIPQERRVSAISAKPDSFGAIYHRPETAIRFVPNGDGEFQPFTSISHAIGRIARGHRPDHLIVDEIRGFDELTEFMNVVNNGHYGSTTFTAHDAHDLLTICFDALTDDGIPMKFARKVIADNIDLILVMEKVYDGSRYCSGIYELPDHTEARPGAFPLEPVPLWVFRQTGTNGQGKIIGEWVAKNKPGSM